MGVLLLLSRLRTLGFQCQTRFLSSMLHFFFSPFPGREMGLFFFFFFFFPTFQKGLNFSDGPPYPFPPVCFSSFRRVRNLFPLFFSLCFCWNKNVALTGNFFPPLNNRFFFLSSPHFSGSRACRLPLLFPVPPQYGIETACCRIFGQVHSFPFWTRK